MNELEFHPVADIFLRPLEHRVHKRTIRTPSLFDDGGEVA